MKLVEHTQEFESDEETVTPLAAALAAPSCVAARTLLLAGAKRPPDFKPKVQTFSVLGTEGGTVRDVPQRILDTCQRGPAYSEVT